LKRKREEKISVLVFRDEELRIGTTPTLCPKGNLVLTDSVLVKRPGI